MTIGDMSVHDVAPIFERINSTGTPLTIVDLMRAATWSPEFDLIDTIDGEVLEAVSGLGFETIERRAVLRNLSAAAGGAFHAASIDDLRNKKAHLEDASKKVVAAYKFTVDFLRTHVGVLNADILPYSNQIVILAEVFRRLPRPAKKQFEALTRWFWRTSASEYFGGWNTGNMLHDHEAIKKFAEGKLDELPVMAVKPTVETWSIASFRANNALSKCFALTVAAQRPRDLITGQPISLDVALAWQNSKEFHHIFPRSIVKSEAGKDATPGLLPNFTVLTSASNKAISNRRPSEYIRECRKALGADFNSVMASNLIDERAVRALLRDNFEAFIDARAKEIHRVTMKLASWSEPQES